MVTAVNDIMQVLKWSLEFGSSDGRKWGEMDQLRLQIVLSYKGNYGMT